MVYDNTWWSNFKTDAHDRRLYKIGLLNSPKGFYNLCLPKLRKKSEMEIKW
jgi:hypothetical protein